VAIFDLLQLEERLDEEFMKPSSNQ